METAELTPPEVITKSRRPLKLPKVDHYAGNAKFLRKALSSFTPEIDITIDLEDGAEVGRERQLAEELAGILAAERSRGAGIRIHPLDSEHWLADLKTCFAICGGKISHITIPKVEDPQMASVAVRTVAALREKHRSSTLTTIPEREFGVHLMIESPRALQHIAELARIRGVCALDFGIMDFVSSLGVGMPREAMRSPLQFEHPLVLAAKTRIVEAALANGLVATHNVTIDLDPMVTAFDDARRARVLGFHRMWSVHPEQVSHIEAGLSPSTEEKAHAEAILRKARENNWGPVKVDGTLYDRASYRWLWEVIRSASTAITR
jgi:citrate lyase subunit beta/citryl-CoA lyase